MYRVDNSTAAEVLADPTAPGVNPDGFFTDGNPGTGTPATVVPAEWLNMIQEEISNVIEDEDGADTPLDKSSRTQLKTAIKSLITNQFSEMVGLYGPASNIVWISASQIQIKAGTWIIADDGSTVIVFDSDQTIDISTTGANGRDTGSEVAGKWYVMAIKDMDTGNVRGLLTLDPDTVTLPAGYTKKCLMKMGGGMVVNNDDLDILKFYSDGPKTYYDTEHDGSNGITDDTRLVTSAGNTTFSPVDASPFVPAGARTAGLHVIGSTASRLRIRCGDSAESIGRVIYIGGDDQDSQTPDIGLNADGEFDAKVSTGNYSLNVLYWAW